MSGRKDDFALETAQLGDDPRLRSILERVCKLTGMGFAAVARVTDTRWIASQVQDDIGFGLLPGEELELRTTICDEIRQDGEIVVIDHVSDHPEWRTHHTPAMYGFESYISLPIRVDGRFFGTLCAIDPAPHRLSPGDLVATMRGFAEEAAAIITARLALRVSSAAESPAHAAPQGV